MTEQGAAPDNVAAMERREAQGPCAKGPARPGTPTPSGTWVPESWRVTPADRKAGERSLASSWRFPALQPLDRGETEQGYGPPRPPENQAAGRRSVG